MLELEAADAPNNVDSDGICISDSQHVEQRPALLSTLGILALIPVSNKAMNNPASPIFLGSCG
jgi:hypothetical protein